MASLNSQLEAALAQFAAQPGVTPDQEAQLRAAITADASVLNQISQQAAAGQLNGFALETLGAAPNLIGTYDKQTGVVTLPAASFMPSAAVASDDLTAVVEVQQMSVDFAHKTYLDTARQPQPVSQNMLDNLQSTFNGSPALAEQMKEAVNQGHVKAFAFLGGAMAAGATYDGNNKIINLPSIGLQTNSASNPKGRYDARDMTFVLGHEIQHGFNHAVKSRETVNFLTDIGTQARVNGWVHNYTDELRAYIQAGREDEAKAEIAGWNALLSREQQSNPSANFKDMLQTRNDRILDFVRLDVTATPPRAVALPGLAFNQDHTLSQTSANIAAMGQHYFDRPSPAYAKPGERPVGLGEHKPNPTADYTNYYGTWALEQIVAAEDRANVRHQGARPRIAIDMAGLGLKEDLIEMEGLDLGQNKAPRRYVDTSQTPASLGRFHHTQDGSVNPQHDHQHVPVAPAAQDEQGRITANLQAGLIQLGYHHRVSQPLQVNGVDDAATRQAVTAFQARHDLPISGNADQATRQALQQALLAQQQIEQSAARDKAPERNASHSPMARDDSRDPAGLQPFSDPDHPQHALYADVQQRFQGKGHALSEEQLSALTWQMHASGYVPGWRGDVTVYNDRAVVGSFLVGSRMASVELTTPAPPVQETMQGFRDEQQGRAQAMDRLSLQQATAREHGHGMSR